MDFLRQTWVLTAASLRSLPERVGPTLVTVVGITVVVIVLVSLLALVGAASSMVSMARPDMAVVMSRGAPNPPSSILSREAAQAVMNAPGLKRTADGKPYVAASTLVGVDAIRKDGKRATAYFVGETEGGRLVDADRKLIEGRMYRPGVRELIVPDEIRKLYRGFEVGDEVTFRGTVWKVVGVVETPRAIGSTVLRADAATVMSAFGINAFQEARVVLASPGSFQQFKDALEKNPSIKVDVKTEEETMSQVFTTFISFLKFVAYFIGGVMAFGAICGALNSLYASVDARRRELATLRAVGFGGGPIVAAVLLEGMLLALPGALIGGAVAWMFFNNHQTGISGFIFELKVTPGLIGVSILWALAIGLIGAALPALRVVKTPIARGLQVA